MTTKRWFTRPLGVLAPLALALGVAFSPPAYAAPPAAHAAAAAAPAAAGPKVVTHAEAAKAMGHGVMFATGSAMPGALVPAMRQEALARPGRTNAFYMSTFAGEDNFKAAVTDKWHPNLLFISKPTRAAATEAANGADARATIHRASLFELAQRLERDELPIDTVVVRVSPPDAEGNVSLGTSSDLTMLAVQSVLRRHGKVIAEVNPNVPHTRGNRIPYASLTHVVHGDELLVEAGQRAPAATEHAIAANVAKLMPINQRHTLQVGIGDALAGIGDALKDHPMDIWSEMGPPGLLKLVSMPNSKVGHATFTFLHGDNEAYRAMANNPRVVMATSKEVNDPAVIATKPNMVAVNTALEIDVFGNTNAERDGDRVLSAPGGQPDFMKGASMAPTGKAIMALGSVASPAGRGKMSTIVIGLKGPTTTPKGSVDYVVTEWGSTQNMRGQSDAVRAQQLVSVAHPAFRGELADAAKQRGLITEAHAQQIKAGVFHALEAAPEEMREAAADLALEKGAITNDQHTHILIELLTPKLAALAR